MADQNNNSQNNMFFEPTNFEEMDFEQMMSAFAWETQMEHYDLRVFLERIGAYQVTMRPRMPSINDFMFSANVNVLRFYQADLIYHCKVGELLGQIKV